MTIETSWSNDQRNVAYQFIAAAEATGLAVKGEVMFWLLDNLGYKIAPGGQRVHKDVPLSYNFNADISTVFTDTFYADWQEITDEEIARAKDTTDTSTGEQAEGN